VLPSEAYVEWEANVRLQARNHIDRQAFPISEPCHVEAAIYYRARRPDLSGALESIGDVFEGLLWTDDNLIMSWDGSRLQKDNASPRVEITVRW